MIKIMVSACLLGESVRYNGSDMPVSDLKFSELIAANDIVSFCPEVAAGLPTPRPPAEIQNGTGDHVLNGRAQVLGKNGIDVTQAFIKGAELALAICIEHGIKIAVLTEASPSCGTNTIYDGHFRGIKINGMGVTTSLLRSHGIKVISQHQRL